jgi:hypothetical protein
MMAKQDMPNERQQFMERIGGSLDQILNPATYTGLKRKPRQLGFGLFVFHFGDPTDTSDVYVDYISNTERQYMVVAIREWLRRNDEDERGAGSAGPATGQGAGSESDARLDARGTGSGQGAAKAARDKSGGPT